VVLLGTEPAVRAEQESSPVTPPIAFVNVNVLSMQDDLVRPRHTVVVRGDRIEALGATSELGVPPDAIVIDGVGRFLVPGLMDAHVHLEGDGTGRGSQRPDFGDGPLYLAYGVTTVVNLRGTPRHLEWRRRIANGDLTGPTIYTSGEFVNEPRVNTPAEVQAEVDAQAREGYDLIKFHEIMEPTQGYTTAGLDRLTYFTMVEATRAAGIPLVGHAPTRLGLGVVVEARQPLAHIGALSNIYFLPLASNRPWLVTTALAVGTLGSLLLVDAVFGLVRRRRAGKSPPSPDARRARRVAWMVLMTWLLCFVSAGLVLPGGPLFDSVTLRLAFTTLTALAAGATLWLIVTARRVWRSSVPMATRLHAATVSLTCVVGVLAGLIFWVPTVWRSSDAGIEHVAKRLADAGVSVLTTVVNYEAIGGPGRQRLVQDPVMAYIQDDVRARWLGGPQTGPPGYRYTDFIKKVTGALHRAGVPLLAGTDAMGFPRIAPGASLHHELRLLVESGLTPFHAIRSATVVPAEVLTQDAFGVIAAGHRADLLLIDRNPFHDVSALARPVGVMARGRWFPRESLERMLASLASE
jgi:hypothetical protein